MSFDLTNKNIQDTFQNLLQKTGKVSTKEIRPRFNLSILLNGNNSLTFPDTISLMDSSGDELSSKLHQVGDSSWRAEFFLLDWRNGPFKSFVSNSKFSYLPLVISHVDVTFDKNGSVECSTFFTNKWKRLHVNYRGTGTAKFVKVEPSNFVKKHFQESSIVLKELENGMYANVENVLDPLGTNLEILDENKSVIWPLKASDLPWHQSGMVNIEPVSRNEYEVRLKY